MIDELNWFNILKNKCPKCGKDAALRFPYKREVPKTLESDYMLVHQCGFRISERKFNEIASNIINKGLKANIQEYDN